MRLPPMNALRAFEAAARHEGYVEAAEELHVTRGAISRHVKLLEDHLGVQLFRRTTRGVTLTGAGRAFLPVLSAAFAQIAEEAARLSTSATDLRIICPPASSIRWLLPRLPEFRARHPDLNVRLTTGFYRSRGFDPIDYDVGISASAFEGRAADILMERLFPIYLTPMARPDMAATLRVPADLARVTLLHETADRWDWTDWLGMFPVPEIDVASGDVFADVDLTTKAATMGAGVMIGDLALNRAELDAGTLVLPFPDKVAPSRMDEFCILYHADTAEAPKVRMFRDWVLEKGAEERAQLEAGV